MCGCQKNVNIKNNRAHKVKDASIVPGCNIEGTSISDIKSYLSSRFNNTQDMGVYNDVVSLSEVDETNLCDKLDIVNKIRVKYAI